MSFIGQPPIPSYTWAGKPATFPAGQSVHISDYGVSGGLWHYDATAARWKVRGNRLLLKDLGSLSATIAAVEAIKLQYQLPAAGLQLGDRLEARISVTKSGATDTGSVRLRIGTAGTTAGDAAVLNGQFLSAAQVTSGIDWAARIDSATLAMPLGRGDLGYGGGSTTAVSAGVAIPNISNALFVSIGALSSGATNTVIIEDAQLWLVTPS